MIVTDLDKKHRAFWTQFLKLFESRDSPIKEWTFNGRNVKFCRKAGRWFETIVNFGDINIGVSLVLKNLKADEYFDRLRQDELKLRQMVGKKLDFRPPARQRTIRLMREASLEQRNTWSKSHDWLWDTLHAFHRVFMPRLDGLDRGEYPEFPEAPGGGGGGHPRQPDPSIRQTVERAAEEKVKAHFRELGYRVKDVTGDNLGWDFDANCRSERLRLEVKGLSGSDICVELTPNEYKSMNAYRETFRLCVVTSALINPRLTDFAFSDKTQRWESPDGRPLAIKKIVAARCQASGQ